MRFGSERGASPHGRNIRYRVSTHLRRVLGRYGGINEDFVLVGGWGECKADGSQEMVEGVGKVLVKAVEQRALRVGEDLVSGDRVKESSGERSVDAMEEFQENQAYRISFGRQ